MKKNYMLQKRGLGYRITAGAAAVLLFLVSGTSCKKNQVEDATISEENALDEQDLSFMSPYELGLPVDSFVKGSNIEVLSGNFNPNEVVRDSLGVLWISQKDLENSKNIGKSIYDTKNGQYIVTKDSKGNTIVKEKGTGYQIIGEDGKVKETGNGTPAGRKKIEGTEDLIGEEYTVASKDYYNNKGEVVIKKGSTIKNETESRANAGLATSKEEALSKETTTEVYIEEKTSSQEQIIQELIRQGVSEKDARQAVLGNKQEPTTKKSEPTTEVPTTVKRDPNVVRDEESTTKKPEPTTKKSEPTTEAPTTQKQSSGYYEIYGMKFLSKADYDQWVIQGYTGYSEVNGVMRADTKEMNEAYQKSIGGKN